MDVDDVDDQGQLALATDVLSNVLLPFQYEMVTQLIEADALCILAQGLAWQQIVGVLLRLQEVLLRSAPQPNRGVVLILGATEWQRETLKQVGFRRSMCHHRATIDTSMTPSPPQTNQELRRLDPIIAEHYESTLRNAASTSVAGAVRTLTSAEAPADITNEVPASDRLDLYHTRGCLFVTTRILVVDLLASRIRPKDIAGMVILNAHRVTDTSGEAFAVRLYRAGNSSGFVRAVSDSPLAFNVGFNKVGG